MNQSLPLPLAQPRPYTSEAMLPFPVPSRRLPVVERVARPGRLLHPTPLGPEDEVLGLNLTRGCVHRCGFCSARAYPGSRGQDTVALFADTAGQLARELATKKPRAVFVSPSTDPFPPINEIQAETAEVVEVLAGHGVEAWLMTRGLVRPKALEVLSRHRDRGRVTVAMTTLDRHLQRTLEPWAAPPRLRLRQIARLRRLGVPVQVVLDPLAPGVTDTRENLAPLLEGLAKAGVRQVTAGYLFLREAIADNLSRELAGTGLDEVIVGAFRDGPLLAAPGLAKARYLSKVRRQRGYAALMALAATHDIKVSISALTNPDFAPARKAEAVESPEPHPSLLSLFLQASRRWTQ